MFWGCCHFLYQVTGSGVRGQSLVQGIEKKKAVAHSLWSWSNTSKMVAVHGGVGRGLSWCLLQVEQITLTMWTRRLLIFFLFIYLIFLPHWCYSPESACIVLHSIPQQTIKYCVRRLWILRVEYCHYQSQVISGSYSCKYTLSKEKRNIFTVTKKYIFFLFL